MLDWPGCFCWGPTREGAIARGWSQVMGFARIASDGVLIGYVAGVVVHPHWQGRALGTRVVERLLEGLRRGALHSRGAQ
jgi:ribosomal protein S18 acetylase RimI-like enzyme